MINRSIVMIGAALLLSACTTLSSGFQDNYSVSTQVKDGAEFQKLAKGETATVKTVDDLETELNTLREQGYLVIGFSQFSGPAEGDRGIQDLAQQHGATLVLTSAASEGRKIKYKTEFHRDSGAVLVPVKAPPGGGPDSEPVSSEGYATQEWFRQTALFLARKQ